MLFFLSAYIVPFCTQIQDMDSYSFFEDDSTIPFNSKKKSAHYRFVLAKYKIDRRNRIETKSSQVEFTKRYTY